MESEAPRVIEILAKPKKAKLKNTLDTYRKLMTPEKQKRIECELGLSEVSAVPDPKCKVVRKTMTEKLNNAIELLEQIERKIEDDLIDEIADKLSKKLPKLIAEQRAPIMMTSNVQKVQHLAHQTILNACGEPKNHEEEIFYSKLAGVVRNYIIQTMMQSMSPIKTCKRRKPKLLKSVVENEELLNIAQDLLGKIEKYSPIKSKSLHDRN